MEKIKKLTVKHDVLCISGTLLFQKGEEVKVAELQTRKGYYGSQSGVWYPEKITGVKIKGRYGIWFPRMFEELNSE